MCLKNKSRVHECEKESNVKIAVDGMALDKGWTGDN